VLQRVAACCSVVQFVAVQMDYTSSCGLGEGNRGGAQMCGAVCCSVVQCGAVCCGVLQCVAVCCSVVQYGAVWCSEDGL